MPLETYLVNVLQPLLKRPEKALIVRSEDDQGVLLTMTLAQEDMGSVIGKAGETIKAVRLLLRIAGMKQEARVAVKINEPDGSPYRPWRKEQVSVAA